MITKFTEWHVWLWYLTKWRVYKTAMLLYFCAMSSRQLAILSSAVSSLRCTNVLNCQPENLFGDNEVAHFLQNWQNGAFINCIGQNDTWPNGKLMQQPWSFTWVKCHFINLAFCQVLFLQYPIWKCWIVNHKINLNLSNYNKYLQRIHSGKMNWHIYYIIDTMAYLFMPFDKMASWQNNISPLFWCDIILPTCHFVNCCLNNLFCQPLNKY